jgi:hypothetical protein
VDWCLFLYVSGCSVVRVLDRKVSGSIYPWPLGMGNDLRSSATGLGASRQVVPSTAGFCVDSGSISFLSRSGGGCSGMIFL